MGNKKRGAAWDKRKWVAINVGIGYAVRTRDNRSFVVCVIPDVTDEHVKNEIIMRGLIKDEARENRERFIIRFPWAAATLCLRARIKSEFTSLWNLDIAGNVRII